MPVIAPVLSTDVAVTVAPDPGQSLPQATLNTVPLAYPEPPEIRDADPIPRPDRYVPVKPDPLRLMLKDCHPRIQSQWR